MTNTTGRGLHGFGPSTRGVLIVFALILAVSTKSYAIQEMLFWLGVVAILLAVVILTIGVSMVLRQIGRTGYRWITVAMACLFPEKRNRLTHNALDQLPHR